MFTVEQERLRIDDVPGVWPLHGIVGTWGGVSAGIFGSSALWGIGGASFLSQLIGSLAAIGVAFSASSLVYGVLKKTMGIRISPEDEMRGTDLSIHQIAAYPVRGILS